MKKIIFTVLMLPVYISAILLDLIKLPLVIIAIPIISVICLAQKLKGEYNYFSNLCYNHYIKYKLPCQTKIWPKMS